MAELNIALRPSRLLAGFVISTHLLAASAPWFAALPFALALGLDTLVVLSAWQLWRLRKSNPDRLSYRDGCWYLGRDAKDEAVDLVGEFLVTPWLIVLRFVRVDRSTVALVLPPDAAAPNDLRRLRVLLRYGLQAA